MTTVAAGSPNLPVEPRPIARIAALASFLPAQVLSYETLAAQFPEWPAHKSLDRTAIRKCHFTAADQTFRNPVDRRATVGPYWPEQAAVIIRCSQAPDFVLPTYACLLQHKLGLPRSAGDWTSNWAARAIPTACSWRLQVSDMCFVDPRPLLMKHLPLYTKHQVRRPDVWPGISG